MKFIRLTQIDGKLPNLALMKLAKFYRERDYYVNFSKDIERCETEFQYEHVYGSAIFNFSNERVTKFKQNFPNAVVGGTYNVLDPTTVEQALNIAPHEKYDYSIYPNFDGSIGFTQRGCRFKCGFCVVPKKEGKPQTVNTIASIWRGDPYPRHLHLLDNDFFGQNADQWQMRIAEIKAGGFKVCLNQGINIRMINDESAKALASIRCTDDQFKIPRVYTAWDNIGDEKKFFDGVECLARNGVRPYKLMVYMLVGYDRRETWERVLYRFNRMTAINIRPYPMVYGDRKKTLPTENKKIEHRTLGEFQRWAIRKYYKVVPFEEYNVSAKGHGTLMRAIA